MAWSRAGSKSEVTDQVKDSNEQVIQYQIRSLIRVRDKAEVRNWLSNS